MIRLSPARRALLQRSTPAFLVFLSVALLVLGKADGVLLGALRARAIDLFAPALSILSRPLEAAAAVAQMARDWADVYRRNEVLSRDNRRLLEWRQAALRLAEENAELRALLKLVPGRQLSFVSARVIADSGGAFAQSLLVDAGSEEGVRRGEAVLGGSGLAGRITDVGRRAARVLLITDLNSRVPVFVEGAQTVRALLAGDNSPHPRLKYFPAKAAIKIGDRVVTSGIGGLFPPNLPVGVVSGFDGAVPRVEPYVRFSGVAYLRIVDYGLAQGLPAPVSSVGPRDKRPRGRAFARR